MPILVAAGALAILGFKIVSDEVEDTVTSTVPNLALLAALGLAGWLLWQRRAK